MYKKTIGFLTFLFIALTVNAQVIGNANYLIKYELEFILDTNNRDNVRYEIHRLYTGTNASQYISEGLYKRDSIEQAVKDQPHLSKNDIRVMLIESERETEFHAIVYKDFTNLETWIKNKIDRTPYLYLEPHVPVVWSFEEASKQIGDYLAQKATTSFGGRDWEAWSTLEVPIPDGPYVFSGLPGLILELYDSNKDYHFNVASMTPLQESYSIQSENKNLKKLSKEEFIKYFKQYQENPLGELTRMLPSNYEMPSLDGRTITLKDMERNAKEEAAKRNNLIEIW